MGYDYENMVSDIHKLELNSTNYFSIGKSVMGRDILCIKEGIGNKKLFLAGAYHGLEYLTSAVLVKFMSEIANNRKKTYMGYDVEKLLEKVTLYTVPMVNPDGVDIAVNGIDITNCCHRELIEKAGIHKFSEIWQANARGVDINHNYDADWKSVTDKPSPSKYGGSAPETEPETKATVDFIRKEAIDMMIAFHSQGREIYYDFNGQTGKRSYEIVQKLSEVSGYKAAKPEGTASFGGCKDWFIKEFCREGFTVEIGSGKNPLPMEMLDNVYDENARLILCAMRELGEE